MEETFRKNKKAIKETQPLACTRGNVLAGIFSSRDNFSDDGHRCQTDPAPGVGQIVGLLPCGHKYQQRRSFMVRWSVGGSKCC